MNTRNTEWDDIHAGMYVQRQRPDDDVCGPVQGARPKQSASDTLRAAAKTKDAKAAEYGENYRAVGPIMAILFPHGIPATVLHADRWHLFELLVVKITRFAMGGAPLTHVDSIHDAMVYAAMIEASLKEAQ